MSTIPPLGTTATTSDRNNQKAPPEISRNICLPGDDYVIQSWKVTAGSPVRTGDKIAVAVRRVNGDSAKLINPSVTATNSSAASTAAASHRRPKKRRRPGLGNGNEVPEGGDSGEAAVTTALPLQKDSHQELKDVANSRPLQPQDSVTLIAPADGLLRIAKEVNHGVVGFVEACRHPQILMGMCTVCGTAVTPNSQSEPNNNVGPFGNNSLNNTNRQEASATTMLSNGDHTRSNVTVSGGITMIVSEQEGQQIAQQTAERLNKQRKLSLVLDLDHTLVHATYDARARMHLNRDDVRTVVLPVYENISHPSQRQAWTWHYIKLRPHVKEFLESVLPMYEVGVYTAGTRLYAEQITMILSRHVVGAVMDQPELDGLRHRIAQMEHELKQQQQQQQAMEDSSKPAAKEGTKILAQPDEQAKEVAKVDDAAEVDADSTAAGKDSSEDTVTALNAQHCDENGQDTHPHNEQPSRTRKRVTFDAHDNVGEAAANPDHHQQQPEQINGEGIAMNGIPPAVEQDEDVSRRKRVRFGEADQNSWYNDAETDPEDEDSDAARGGCKPRKRVSFGEPPESNRVDASVVEELRLKLAEGERLELAASKLRQQLFGSRIVSRTDVGDLGKDVKSLRRIFPCGGTMAVVVDDREDVWANALDNASGRKGEPPENLLLVRPYHWKPFLGFADVNNAAGADLSASSSTPANGTAASTEGNSAASAVETDVQLLWTKDILERLHRNYFAKNANRDPPKSVASILHDMRAKVLKNTKIVLSALVPLRKQTRTASQTTPRPPVVRIAESLGAKLMETVDPSVTHVVAAKDGTEKIIRARRLPTCQVVKASWLMECLWSLTRRDEQPHWFSSSSGAVSPLRQPPPLRAMPIANYNNYTKKSEIVLPLDPRTESTTSSSSSSSNSDNEDDEEDFAATLENELMDS